MARTLIQVMILLCVTGNDVLNGQIGAGLSQSVVVEAGELNDLVGVVGQLLAGEVLGVVGIVLGGGNEHVGEDHVIEAVGGNRVIALDGVVDHQESEEGVGIVSAGLSGHGAGLELGVEVGQEVGGDNSELAGQAEGLDAGDRAEEGVTAAAGDDQSVNVGIGLDNGLCGLAAGVGGGAAVLGLKKLDLIIEDMKKENNELLDSFVKKIEKIR